MFDRVQEDGNATTILKWQATIDDLSRTEGKAGLVNWEIVHMPPIGATQGLAGDEIYSSLRAHVRTTGVGRAVGEN